MNIRLNSDQTCDDLGLISCMTLLKDEDVSREYLGPIEELSNMNKRVCGLELGPSWCGSHTRTRSAAIVAI